eukprot:scaffold3566_cov119-Isochrysis_galbana.AAC.9
MPGPCTLGPVLCVPPSEWSKDRSIGPCPPTPLWGGFPRGRLLCPSASQVGNCLVPLPHPLIPSPPPLHHLRVSKVVGPSVLHQVRQLVQALHRQTAVHTPVHSPIQSPIHSLHAGGRHTDQDAVHSRDGVDGHGGPRVKLRILSAPHRPGLACGPALGSDEAEAAKVGCAEGGGERWCARRWGRGSVDRLHHTQGNVVVAWKGRWGRSGGEGTGPWGSGVERVCGGAVCSVRGRVMGSECVGINRRDCG